MCIYIEIDTCIESGQQVIFQAKTLQGQINVNILITRVVHRAKRGSPTCWLYFADITIWPSYPMDWGVKFAESSIAYISYRVLWIELNITAYGEGMIRHLITTLCISMLRILQCPEGQYFLKIECLLQPDSITNSKFGISVLKNPCSNFWSN